MFTQSLFMPDSTQAASATVDGDVVLWDQALLPEQSMKVHSHRTVMQPTPSYGAGPSCW